MPRNYSDVFKRDVVAVAVAVAVAKQGAATQRQIAKDFGVLKSALSTWMRAAELQERGLVGPSIGVGVAGDVVVLREALKRIRLPEQEAEVMRRAVA